MPGDTPKACPSCGANYRDLRWYIRDTWSGMIYRRVSAPIGGESRRCTDEWHDGAPLAFDAAIAALDVEPRHDAARMVTTYDILGLDAVRAAHRAEVERAVAERDEARRALSGHLFDGESLSLREAIRSEMLKDYVRAINDRDAATARVAKLEAEQSDARKRAARLEAALRFYADDANYRFQNDAEGSLRSPAVNEDHGAEARAALEDKP